LTGQPDPKLRDLGKQTILSLSSDMLREGVELIPSSSVEGGAKVRLVGEQLEIDLSDKAISKMLADHLLPRFQAILTGAE
jgi:V/A-type H+-transporting ATPase subunit E